MNFPKALPHPAASEHLLLNSSETLLTEHDLAARQARSVKTIRNDRVKGAGAPFIKIGRLVRYRLADVLEWEQAHLRRSTSDVGGGNG